MEAKEPVSNGKTDNNQNGRVLHELAERFGFSTFDALYKRLVEIAEGQKQTNLMQASDVVHMLVQQILERPESFAVAKNIRFLAQAMWNTRCRRHGEDRMCTNAQDSLQAVIDHRTDEQNEMRIAVLEVIARMPKVQYQRVLRLRINGHSYEEIAKIEGMAVSTVSSLCVRGMQHVRDIVRQYQNPAHISKD